MSTTSGAGWGPTVTQPNPMEPRLTTTGPPEAFMPKPPPIERGPIRYYEGHEPEAIARQARWEAAWREVRARWGRVYNPVHARATGRLRWEVESHAPVYGYSSAGPPPDRPHCGRCWPDSYTGAERDWPCEPFRDLRREVARLDRSDH